MSDLDRDAMTREPRNPFYEFGKKLDFLLGIKGSNALHEYQRSGGLLPDGFPGIRKLDDLRAAIAPVIGREIKDSLFSEYRGGGSRPPGDVVHTIARLYGFGGLVDIDKAFEWWSEHWPGWWTSKPFDDVPDGHKRRDSAALFAKAYLEALKENRLKFPAKPAPRIEATEPAALLSPAMRREQEFKVAIGALRASRSIGEARRRKDSAFQLLDRFERALGLMEGVLASTVPDRIERLSRLYAPLENDIRRIEAEGLVGCFDTLDRVKAGLDAISPAQPAVAANAGIQNDLLLGEELPHWQARQHLLDELDSVERRLQEAVPVFSEDERQQLSFDLEELRIILDRDPIRPEELSDVRDRLDVFNRKLDLLRRLRIAMQLFMGIHAELLPPGAVFQDDERVPEMVVVPADSFTMGSAEDEKDGPVSELPRHNVRMAQRFALGRYPVTFEEYDRFADATGREPPGDKDWGRIRQPVIHVSWKDAENYVAWLSEPKQTGKPYRLPSEAEWEYACRAGTTTRYSFGDTITPEQANYDENVGQITEVGRYPVNPRGLYDMHGNVWEWCRDVWHGNYDGAPDDGSAWLTDDKQGRRVLRGGSWSDDPAYLRSSFRFGFEPVDRGNSIGFRVARTLR